MRSTRTYVRYFGLEQVDPIRVDLMRLEDDFEVRARFIDPEEAEQGRERLKAVRLAVARLTDRAE